MNAKLLTLVLVLSVAAPSLALAKNPHEKGEKVRAHYQTQKAENQAFRETLKDMPKEQRKEAILTHRTDQFTENMTFHAQAHQEHMAELRNKLAANTQLTEDQKQAILAKAESDYAEKAAKAQQRHAENMAFAEKLAQDTTLTPEQKHQQMKAYIEKNKQEAQNFRTEQKEKRREFRGELQKQYERIKMPAQPAAK